MPSYSRFIGRKMTGGYSQTVKADGVTINKTIPHTDFNLGFTQTMVQGRPKGSPVVLLRDPETFGFYLPVYPVSFNRVEVEASPLNQTYWMYGHNMWYVYHEPSGLARLSKFQDVQTSVVPVPTQRRLDIALTMALSRVGTGPFMGAVDLGEVAETLRFLKSPFRGLADIFTGYTKKVERNFAKAGQQRTITATRRPKTVSRGRKWYPRLRSKEYEKQWRSDLLADTWLEYRYAASPLILSTMSLAEEATRTAETICQRIYSARGAHVEASSTEFAWNPEWMIDGEDYLRRAVNGIESVESKVAYVIRYSYRPHMVDAINLARYGISPTQVFSTIYELTPLSFVGDWFWNFGEWLKAMEPKPQLKIIDAVYSHAFKREVYIQDVCCGAILYYGDLPGTGAWARFKRNSMTRSIVTDNLQCPIPRLKGKDLTLPQVLDAISLIGRPISKFFSRYGHLIPRWNGSNSL